VKQRRLIIAALGMLWVAGPAMAQVPTAADPAQADRRATTPLPHAPTSTAPEPEAGGLPMEPIPEGAQEITFVLNELTVEGVTAYDAGEFEHLYKDRVGTTITLKDVYDIAAQITKHYRDSGYFLSKAFVPPQTIKGGQVRILVVEGYVADVASQG